VYQCQRAGYRATLFQLKTHDRVNHDSQLATLAPFLDEQGLIILSGRTEAAPLVYEAKYPLILHAKDPITTVLLRHLHQKIMHAGGPRALQTELSKFFWIPKVTTLLNKITYRCVICRRRLAKPTTQIEAPLPFFRLLSSKINPFDHSAINVAGPFLTIFQRTPKERETFKRWMLVI
jgi:hypothetical protein